MDWVVEQIRDTLCYLECTNSTNIPFYKKYGFELVEEIKLEDEKDHNHQCVLYYMVRGEAPEALEIHEIQAFVKAVEIEATIGMGQIDSGL